MPSRVLALTAPYPGVQEWFRHGHEEGFWDYHVLETPVDAVEPRDIVLLGAWHPMYETVLKHAKWADTEFYVGWTSTPTEMGHSPVEWDHLASLIRDDLPVPIEGFACLDEGIARALPDGFHLPAPVHVPPLVPQGERDGVGFYAPQTIKKNISTQILAMRLLQSDTDEDLPLYHNLGDWASRMDLFNVDHEPQGWVPREDHLQRLAARKLALAASHAESWCYGAVDALSAGTPVVGAPTISWLPNTMKVNDPSNALEVATLARDLIDRHDPELLYEDLKRIATTQNEWVRGEVKHLITGRFEKTNS